MLRKKHLGEIGYKKGPYWVEIGIFYNLTKLIVEELLSKLILNSKHYPNLHFLSFKK